jgi:predicted nucleotidyltransferase
MNELLNKTEKILISLRTRFNELGIDQAGIFGSVVRGDYNSHSDVDILLRLKSDSKLTLFSLIELEQYISELLERDVDLMLEKDLRPEIHKNVIKEVKLVS